MKYGLIGAGPVNKYLAAKLPRLSRELGLVAAANRRAASRIVNTLGAGEAGGLADLHSAELILICAPDDHFLALRPVLEQTAIEWAGKSLVLCQCRVFSRDLEFFRSRGASVASLHGISGLRDRFVIEGDRDALKAARYLVAQLRSVPIQIDPESYSLYCAAQTLASSLFTPLLDGCMTAVRAAGVSGKMPAHLMEALFLHSIRSFLYSGRKSWSGTVARGDEAAVAREAEALEKIRPRLAHFYRVTADASMQMLVNNKPIVPNPERA